MRRARALATGLVVVAVAGCSSAGNPTSTTNGKASPPGSASTVVVDDATPERRVDPDAPLAADVAGSAPTELGALFATADDPLPAQTTSALANAGGEALTVNEALSAFGLFGIPRPSGINSAVMELRSAGSLLAGTGSTLTAEVVYMVASAAPIEDLLAAAAGVDPAQATVDTVADYDGTVGDPRCARLTLGAGPVATGSVEGCEYRADPLQEVRSVGFRRLNLPVAEPLRLPPVFDAVPDELLAAGTVEAFTGSFGRPSGPSGNTVQLEVRVLLERDPVLDDGWMPDGAGRWWREGATLTVNAGVAVWRLSSRAEQL